MPFDVDPHSDTDVSLGQPAEDEPLGELPTRGAARTLALLMLVVVVLGVLVATGQMILGG